MPDGVFHERLQDQIRHGRVERRRIDLHFQLEPVAEADLFDRQVAPEELDFLLKRHLLLVTVRQGYSQQFAEP